MSHLSYEALNHEMEVIFTKYERKQEIIDQIDTYLKIKDPASATFERVNTMVEFLQCYPILVKKNKNASPGISQVFPLPSYDNNDAGKKLKKKKSEAETKAD